MLKYILSGTYKTTRCYKFPFVLYCSGLGVIASKSEDVYNVKLPTIFKESVDPETLGNNIEHAQYDDVIIQPIQAVRHGYTPQYCSLMYKNFDGSYQDASGIYLVTPEGVPEACVELHLRNASFTRWGTYGSIYHADIDINNGSGSFAGYADGGVYDTKRYYYECTFEYRQSGNIWYHMCEYTEKRDKLIYEWDGSWQLENFEYSSVSSSLTQNDILSFYKSSNVSVPYPNLPDIPDDSIKTALTRSAVADLDFMRVGWLENLTSLDLSELSALTDNIVSAMKNGVRDKAKLFGDLYLNYKFEVQTTQMDLKTIRDGFKKVVKTIFSKQLEAHSKLALNGTEYRCTIWCNPYSSGTYIRRMSGWTLRPSDVWACLPFSFMVDWVLHTTDELQNVEDAWDYSRNIWHVTKVCYTSRNTSSNSIPVPLAYSETGYITVKSTGFRRVHKDSLPAYQYQPPDYGLHFNLDHLAEGLTIVANYL